MSAEGEQVPLPPGYRLVRRLGRGGFATVWLAEQGRLGRRVAVKVIDGSVDDPDRERRFLAECRAVGSLSGHPAVITVHDAGVTPGGHPYLVMEHLPGGSLQDLLDDSGPVPWEDALRVGVSVADALAAAHDAGILHRDVKPANVLVAADGSVRLGDFGIARLAVAERTRTGVVVGTIRYTPPEVLSGKHPDVRSDLWALGVTLYALMSGRSPYAGDDDEPPVAAIARIVSGEDPPPLSEPIPGDVAAAIRTLMHADPDQRPPDAAAATRLLRSCQAAHDLGAAPVRPTTPISDPILDVAPPPAPVERPDPSRALQTKGESTVPLASGRPRPARTLGRPGAEGTGGAPAAEAAPTEPTRADESRGAPTRPVPAAGPTPGRAPPGVQRPVGSSAPPPPGAPSATARGNRGLLVVTGAFVLVVILVTGLALGLRSGGDDDGVATSPSSTATSAVSPVLPEPTFTSLSGAPVPAPPPPAGEPEQTGVAQIDCADARCGAGASASRAVIATTDGQVRALSPARGGAEDLVEWEARVPAGIRAPGVFVTEALVVIGVPLSGERRSYLALEPGSGEERWETTLDHDLGRFAIAPDNDLRTLILDGGDPDDRLPDGIDRGRVTALDGESGEVLWRAPGVVLGIDDDRVFVSDGERVAAVDRSSGDAVWQAEVATGDRLVRNPFPRAALAGDHLVVISGSEAVGLAVASGQEAWRQVLPPGAMPTTTSGTVSPVASSDSDGPADLVVVSGTGGFVGLAARDGRVRWSDTSGDPVRGDPVVLFWAAEKGRFVIARSDGAVVIYSVADGRAVAAVTVEGAEQYALLDGQLLVRTADGVTGLDLDDLAEAWQVGDAVERVVAAPRGFLTLAEGEVLAFAG